ncbi:MAG: hypothetical protein ACFFE8_14615 [Candidatus Heimdallarchaeota archaeon]
MVSFAVLILVLLAFVISGFLSRLLLPWIIKASLNRDITTIDAHKPEKPIIAEPGGLAPLLATIFTILILVFSWEYITPELAPNPQVFQPLLAGLLSVVIAGLIGFLDDVFRISWRAKLLLGFLPAFPLMALEVGKSTVGLGPLGVLDLRFIVGTLNLNLYSLIIIPLAVNFAFNSFNMFAGFNGLETGNGTISLFAILLLSLIVENPIVALFSSALLGGFIVILWFNWYPARTLIGDTGTLTLGTGIIVAIIIGNMDRLALGLFGLHFLNFVLFLGYLYTRQTEKIASIDNDGNIVAPSPFTVYWLLPYYLKNIGERKNVLLLLLAHTIIVSIVFLLSLPIYSS